MRPDEILDALAATQHGVVARDQLLAAGLTGRQVDLRRQAGRLAQLHAGVYLVRGHPPALAAQLTAACLAAGPGAVASHRGAAAVLGLDGIPPAVEISVPIGCGSQPAGVIVHRVAELARPDVIRAGPAPHTAAARTIIDLAGVVPVPLLGRALDDALTRRLVTCAYLQRRLDSLGRQGRHGAGRLRQLLAERAGGRPRHQSEFERRLFAVLAAAGMPLPETQYEVPLPDGRLAVLDFAYPRALFGLEADSYEHHSSHAAWGRDHVRNRGLIAVGWRILPVIWADLMQPAPLLDAVSRGLRAFPRSA